VTDEVRSVKTKKIPQAFVRAAATKEHPAQVDLVAEDVIIGYWKTIKMSGALPAKRIADVLERITKLQAAVKIAREEANTIQTDKCEIGKAVFAYLLA
jgi:hypothetical protein